jgi:predicted restriction endonuclease
MNSKVRCSNCREKHDRATTQRAGLYSFCSDECRRAHANKAFFAGAASPSRSRKQASASKFPEGLRDAVLERDLHRCRFCGTRNSPPRIHHIKYRSEGGEHLIDNLITLCDTCHIEVHSSKRTYQPILFEIRDTQILVKDYIDGRQDEFPTD